ncbi:MAG: YbaB/EbfC family nucleoid-associated protein [Clostridia bacterium]|nr:YbaB/EbfC family nucleoid-associated protein [Clostridia bacterium]MDO4835030.1 YbaB/EbfC family nucleoid-associated protein [Clostridia bacterium]
MARGGFPMGGGMNMQQMMMKAQKMQQEIQKKQQELNETEFSATAGGGMVTVTVLGDRTVRSIKLDPACVDPDDVEMLEDLIVAGVNAALKEASDTVEREMGRITGGMGLGF